jgi:hypothetical protein
MPQRVREDLARVRIVIDNKDSWRSLFWFQFPGLLSWTRQCLDPRGN